MTAGDRDEVLASTARRRSRRLADVVDGAGRPWHERPGRLASAPMPDDGWYRDY